MESRHLQQIVEICRARGFSAAARRLNIAQSTLSKNIARLEAQLSVKLFDREGGSARPTEYGLFLAQRGEAVLRAVTAITHDFEQLTHGETGRLRIGVGVTYCLDPLRDVIQHTAERFPSLQIETHRGHSHLMLHALQTDRYDVIFCTSDGVEAYENLIRVKIFEDRYVVVARPDHPLLKDIPLSPAKLLKFPMASFGIGLNFKHWAGKLTPEAARNLEAFVSDDHELIRSRPLGTDFVARAPEFVFEQELRSGRLVELPTVKSQRFEFWMLTTKARWQSPVVKAVAGFAKANVASRRYREAGTTTGKKSFGPGAARRKVLS